MPHVKVITLNAEQRAALEKQAKHGSTPSYRLRCQAVLLKSHTRTSLAVAKQLGCCEMAVNNAMKRYQQHGLAGLKTKTGRGRKAILQTDTDLATVRRAVEGSRQRISLAKAELEQELGKEFSQLTLQAASSKKRWPLQTHSARRVKHTA